MKHESAKDSQIKKEAPKPPKPEEKPFEAFINEDFIPGLRKSLSDIGFPPESLLLVNGERPVVGGNCWMVIGQMTQRRTFWLCFSKNLITSSKVVTLAENGSNPSVLESFLIDERKITLQLLISRIMQRLNGQKWLGAN